MRINNSKSLALSALSLTMVTLSSFATGGSAHYPPKHGSIHSYASVRPIIEAKCVSCHNDKRHPESVNLSSYQKLMKSGEHGPMVVPGHPEKSKLLRYIDGEKQPRMPFKQSPLSKNEISTIKDWIKAGAKP